MFGIRAVVDRCGVIAGPWQMGKVDQGVFTYWLLGHYFGGELRYIGYGGVGKQVRDLLHVDDLADLIEDQLLRPEHWDGATANVGGGSESSLSLLETTELCAELTGNGSRCSPRTRPGRATCASTSPTARAWLDSRLAPAARATHVLEDTLAWVADNERTVQATLA